MTDTVHTERKPLAYHFASEEYGRGVCGTYGMTGTLDNPNYPVTCARCLKHGRYLAAVNITGRYTGSASHG